MDKTKITNQQEPAKPQPNKPAKPDKKKGQKDTPFYKRKWFLIAAGVVGLVILIPIIAGGGGSEKPKEEEHFDNEKIDVNGLVINEACEKVREKGWTVKSVTGVGGGKVTTSDCSDDTHKVTSVDYKSNKAYTDMPVVILQFSNESSQETTPSSSSTSSETAAPTTQSKPSSSTSSSSSSSSTSSSSSSKSTWKQFLSDYESWVTKYVAFMKKYKNASTADIASMMNDYSALLKEQAEWTSKLQNMQGGLSGSDLTEYLSTLSRINAKLAEIK